MVGNCQCRTPGSYARCYAYLIGIRNHIRYVLEIADFMEMRFLPLLLVVLLATIVPFLLARFRRILVVVGEILAEIIGCR